MTLKVTGKVVIIFIMLFGCHSKIETTDDLEFQQELDAQASAAIDSAYRVVQLECEEKKQNQLPVMIDSLLQLDSLKNKQDNKPMQVR